MSCHMMQFSLHSMHKYSAFEATSHVHSIFVGGATNTCQQYCSQRLCIQHFSEPQACPRTCTFALEMLLIR